MRLVDFIVYLGIWYGALHLTPYLVCNLHPIPLSCDMKTIRHADYSTCVPIISDVLNLSGWES